VAHVRQERPFCKRGLVRFVLCFFERGEHLGVGFAESVDKQVDGDRHHEVKVVVYHRKRGAEEVYAKHQQDGGLHRAYRGNIQREAFWFHIGERDYRGTGGVGEQKEVPAEVDSAAGEQGAHDHRRKEGQHPAFQRADFQYRVYRDYGYADDDPYDRDLNAEEQPCIHRYDHGIYAKDQKYLRGHLVFPRPGKYFSSYKCDHCQCHLDKFDDAPGNPLLFM
jgi:hypothetical protein